MYRLEFRRDDGLRHQFGSRSKRLDWMNRRMEYWKLVLEASGARGQLSVRDDETDAVVVTTCVAGKVQR